MELAEPSVSKSEVEEKALKDDVKVREVPYGEQVKCSCCGRTCTQRFYILVLFTITNMFLFADQNLLAPNLTVIAEEFNFTDDERDTYLGGYISLGFFVIGGIVAMIVGYLADTMNRKYVFAATVTLGEISCMLTYWVPTGDEADFWSGLWLTRAVTGIAIGGALPIQYSMMGDLFGDGSRGRAVSFFAIATAIGSGAGQVLANFMSPDWLIYLITTREPKRGAAEDALHDEDDFITANGKKKKGFTEANIGDKVHTLDWEKLKSLLSRPSVALIIFQGLPGSLPWGIALVFLNDFFKEEKELDNGEAALALFAFSIGSFFSVILGGIIQDKLWKKAEGKYRPIAPIFAGVTTLISPFLLHYVLVVNPGDLDASLYALFLFLSGFLAGFAGPIVKGILLLITLPETRGSAFALQSLLDELGKGLGPFLVSAIITAAPDRQTGLIIAGYGWIPTAFMQMAIGKYLANDVARNVKEVLHEYKPELETENAEVEVVAAAEVQEKPSV
eukprot:snap_masked-scaffold_9-processed-gene-11.47-mRNA-1 protein AED:0.41 eAED:0.45 QI:0/0/0/1/1/1/3/0/503